jgi:hypothetical protein
MMFAAVRPRANDPLLRVAESEIAAECPVDRSCIKPTHADIHCGPGVFNLGPQTMRADIALEGRMSGRRGQFGRVSIVRHAIGSDLAV